MPATIDYLSRVVNTVDVYSTLPERGPPHDRPLSRHPPVQHPGARARDPPARRQPGARGARPPRPLPHRRALPRPRGRHRRPHAAAARRGRLRRHRHGCGLPRPRRPHGSRGHPLRHDRDIPAAGARPARRGGRGGAAARHRRRARGEPVPRRRTARRTSTLRAPGAPQPRDRAARTQEPRHGAVRPRRAAPARPARPAPQRRPHRGRGEGRLRARATRRPPCRPRSGHRPARLRARLAVARRRRHPVHRPGIRVPAHGPARAGALRRPGLAHAGVGHRAARLVSDLDDGRPVVHVTQGTVANRDFGDLVLPTIRALADADVWVVASTGGRPVAELGADLPANARVAPYLPYDRLLPRTAVYVTNGGYGGIHYAMEHGVPVVAAGTTEDKTEVLARVAWSGVGVKLATNRPDAAAVGAAVRTVLDDPAYAERSARIGRAIRSSSGLDGVERAVQETVGAEAATRPRRTSTSPSRR
ncbi:MAG: nucleotide disphospho-sugar-binding domain-containing protein [Leifsonia sp.]